MRILNQTHKCDHSLTPKQHQCSRFAGRQLVGCSEHLGEVATDLPWVWVFSHPSVSSCNTYLHDVEIRALWGSCHHSSISLFFSTLRIDFGWMFGVIVLLQNTFENQLHASLMNKNLPFFFCIENNINPDKISICKNVFLNIYGTSAVLHCFL